MNKKDCLEEEHAAASRLKAAMLSKSKIPTAPGFYWALWLTAAKGTHEGDQLTPDKNWGIVEVWENFIGETCEADADEKFAVSVPGVRESQWLDNFKWGSRVESAP